MKNLGRIFWMIAQLIWIGAIVGYWFVDNKIDTIYSLCLVIGLMLISSRMIDDAES